MGGGGGKSEAEGGMPREMVQIIQRFEEETRGLRGDLVSQMTAALGGDVTGAGVPIVARAQEESRRATSTALKETGTELARSGLAGTPFGERIMAQTRAQGAQAYGQVAPQYLAQLLQLATGYATGQASAVSGALPGTRTSEAGGKQWQAAV